MKTAKRRWKAAIALDLFASAATSRPGTCFRVAHAQIKFRANHRHLVSSAERVTFAVLRTF